MESDIEYDSNYDDYYMGDSTPNSKKTNSVLKEDDIKKRQDEEILRVSISLSIPEAAASKLLHHYKWDVSELCEEWCADEEAVRNKVGLLSFTVPLSTTNEPITCQICFDILPPEAFYPMVCGHPYCKTCWRAYITASINDGPGCLSLRCPEPSCVAAVCRDMIDDLVTEEEKRKYSYFSLRSYVEESKNIKWCPAPGCENAVEIVGKTIFNVTCLCSNTFCWNCGEDAHCPVDCNTVRKWGLENTSGSQNMAWILANSKPCPKCKRAIEKTRGCMHITCTLPCEFEFCWLCLEDWKQHDYKPGEIYVMFGCNRYEAEKSKGLHDEEEKIREMAMNSVKKYTHYYERWASNQKSREKAIEALHQIKTDKLDKLSNKTAKPMAQLQFITKAWEQIIECRRVLKWTYAYGYYFPEDEHVKKQLFEDLQGKAEFGLEKLHKCAESDLDVFLEDDKQVPEAGFSTYRQKLIDLTVETQSYFTNLVASLETQKW